MHKLPSLTTDRRKGINLVYKALFRLLAGKTEVSDWVAFGADEWNLLRKVAVQERVSGLLHYHWNKSGWPTNIPADVRLALTESYFSNVAQNLLLYRELGPLLERLNTSGVPIVLLKGAALAVDVYPHIGLRPMNDIDLLLHREHVDLAKEILYSRSYQDIPARALRDDPRINYHVALRGGPHRDLVLELHWGLVAGERDPVSPDAEWFWQRTVPLSLELTDGMQSGKAATQMRVKQLSPLAHLLYLCAHLSYQHRNYKHVLWLHDIHLLVEHYAEELDWGEIADVARRFQWSEGLRAALYSAQLCFDTHIPSGFLGEDDHPEASAEIYLGRTRSARHYTILRGLDWKTRVQLALRLVFPTPSFMRWRYRPDPTWLWPFYYPVRWTDMIIDLISTAIKT